MEKYHCIPNESFRFQQYFYPLHPLSALDKNNAFGTIMHVNDAS